MPFAWYGAGCFNALVYTCVGGYGITIKVGDPDREYTITSEFTLPLTFTELIEAKEYARSLCERKA